MCERYARLDNWTTWTLPYRWFLWQTESMDSIGWTYVMRARQDDVHQVERAAPCQVQRKQYLQQP